MRSKLVAIKTQLQSKQIPDIREINVKSVEMEIE